MAKKLKPIVCDKTGESWESYRDYLNSDNWATKREFVRMSGRYRCKCCRSSNNLQTHHKTYSSIGNEKIEDLVILCDKCHSLHHKDLLDYSNPPSWAHVNDSGGTSRPVHMSYERERALNRFRSIL